MWAVISFCNSERISMIACIHPMEDFYLLRTDGRRRRGQRVWRVMMRVCRLQSRDVDAHWTSLCCCYCFCCCCCCAAAGYWLSAGAWLINFFLQHRLSGERSGNLLRRMHVQPENYVQQLLRPVQLVRRRRHRCWWWLWWWWLMVIGGTRSIESERA